jgi:hypothetical protein
VTEQGLYGEYVRTVPQQVYRVRSAQAVAIPKPLRDSGGSGQPLDKLEQPAPR